ncbi:MAG: hypothetical protein ABI867_10470 [Kofleriaceae bacterium]
MWKPLLEGQLAIAWFARALAMRGDHGVAGFAAYRGDAEPAESSYGLLEGAIGIALSLVAAVTPAEPSRDRLLLCDLGS